MNMKLPLALACLSPLALVNAADKPKSAPAPQAQRRPNILWMVSEDNGAQWLGCYGNKDAHTPNLDALARRGFQYTNTYAAIAVCAPSRSTWITGINALSMGTQNMRSGYKVPKTIEFYPELLRRGGYYTSLGNDAKTDYNLNGFNMGRNWCHNKLNWETLKQNQPFFHVMNTHLTHEWHSFGTPKNSTNRRFTMPKYYPDLPIFHQIHEKYSAQITKLDTQVGDWLKELEASGMAEDTIVIYSSDHGGVLPRSKRFLYNSGAHAPLIIYIPPKYKHLYPAAKPGEPVDRLVSFLDFPKTWLSLAEAPESKQMQGRVFLGKRIEKEPEYVFGFQCRMDELQFNVRSVRTKQFLYMRNYLPFAPTLQYLGYYHNDPAMRAWNDQYFTGKCNEVTGQFFKPTPVDQLFDVKKDYDNINNLASQPEYKAMVETFKKELRAWQLKIHDSGLIPESEMKQLIRQTKKTPYEIVRDPELYPLEQYLDMADLVLEKDAKNIPAFLQGMKDAHVGNRYWATIGLVNLGKQADSKDVRQALKKALEDSSHEVRIYAAWALLKLGERELGYKVLSKMMVDSYAKDTVYNVMFWMKEDGLPLADQLVEANDGNKKWRNRRMVTLFIENYRNHRGRMR